MEGLEPTLSEENRILSPVRLPFRHMPEERDPIKNTVNLGLAAFRIS